MSKPILFTFYIIIASRTLLFAQNVRELFCENLDSIIQLSYDELYNRYYQNYRNDSLYSLYAKAFIGKGYKEKDTLQIATGYYMIALKDKDQFYPYNDSLIKYSRLIKSPYWEWIGFHDKGLYFFRNRNFQKAFINHLAAYKIADKENLNDLKNLSQIDLGLLRERVGKQKEALRDFRENYHYELSTIKDKKLEDITEEEASLFLNAMSRLANSYRLNKKLDSARLMNKKIWEYIQLPEGCIFADIATLSSAEIAFDSRQYLQTIDSVNKVLPILLQREDLKNAAIAYHIRGLANMHLNKIKEGIQDLKQMDSIFVQLGDLYPSLRTGYSFLIEHYRQQEDLEKQLYYVKQLIDFDSIINHNHTFITEGLHQELEKPKLVQ